MLHQTIRAIVGDARVLVDQAACTVLCLGWKAILTCIQFAEQRVFAGWHGERAGSEEAKSEGNQWVFHRVLLMEIVVDEREAHFTGHPFTKKFKALMVTIDEND